MGVIWLAAVGAGIGAWFVLWGSDFAKSKGASLLRKRKPRESPVSVRPTVGRERPDMTRLRRMFEYGWIGLALFAVGMLFFDSWLVSALLAAGAVPGVRYRQGTLRRKRRSELQLQFKYAIQAMASSLSAGKSIENAWKDAAEDVRLLYPDPEAAINRELGRINARLLNGEPAERVLEDFSQRAGLEDVSQFAEVYRTCKRTGGDLVAVIRTTADLIGEKIETQREIRVMIAQKKMESGLLTVIPIGIIGMLRFGSPDYMAPLYEGAGRLIMAAGLLLIVLCAYVSRRIMEIEL